MLRSLRLTSLWQARICPSTTRYADHQLDGADNEVSRTGRFRRCRQLPSGRWHFIRRQSPERLANTVDNGTVASTYGGLTRATYNALNAYETAATNSAISLLQLRTTWNNISDGGVILILSGRLRLMSYVEQLQTRSRGTTWTLRRKIACLAGFGLFRASLGRHDYLARQKVPHGLSLHAQS